jgi:HAE1 family hydrophobic/amphiphilic exporter-1
VQLIDRAIRYPVSVVVGVVLAVLFGVIGLVRLPIQMIPTLDRPEISVDTPYPGAGPLEVEEEVTKRQEELLNTVENLRKMTSTGERTRTSPESTFRRSLPPFDSSRTTWKSRSCER